VGLENLVQTTAIPDIALYKDWRPTADFLDSRQGYCTAIAKIVEYDYLVPSLH
jgi:hypothetical protein